MIIFLIQIATIHMLLQHLYYMNIQGLVKQANQIVCKTCDESFITLFNNYITDKQHEVLELKEFGSSAPKFNKENIGQVGNPIVRRPKGRPSGTTRFKGPLEASSNSNNKAVDGRNQNKCGLCNNVGHNRATCPSNSNTIPIGRKEDRGINGSNYSSNLSPAPFGRRKIYKVVIFVAYLALVA